jgi:hypothetical protein
MARRARLRKVTLWRNTATKQWILTVDGRRRTIGSFVTKEAATRSGTLKRALGRRGGSVRIRAADGRFQEERTLPRSRDPRRSRG